jgi:hypothetical protein
MSRSVRDLLSETIGGDHASERAAARSRPTSSIIQDIRYGARQLWSNPACGETSDPPHVGPTDPASYIFGSTVVAVVAFFASFVPARQATRVDPVEVLHEE